MVKHEIYQVLRHGMALDNQPESTGTVGRPSLQHVTPLALQYDPEAAAE